MDNFFLVLAAILLTPVIPAFIIYKFLPASDTDVSGPYQGLSLKLKGAFAGYFFAGDRRPCFAICHYGE